MLTEDQTLEHPEGTTPPEGDDGTTIPKFKSAEDRDRAYLELERQSHAQAQELAEMKRKLDDFSQSQQLQQQSPAAGPSFTDQYKSQEELKQFWARFAANPKEIFREVQEETLRDVEHRIAIRDAARDAISEFKAKHPDLAPYEEIVTMFVQRQPGNLSARERLERAAPEARKMITQIAQRGAPAATSTDPATFVESPSSSRVSGAPAVAPKASEGDEVDEYFAERRASMSKKMGVPSKGGAAA